MKACDDSSSELQHIRHMIENSLGWNCRFKFSVYEQSDAPCFGSAAIHPVTKIWIEELTSRFDKISVFICCQCLLQSTYNTRWCAFCLPDDVFLSSFVPFIDVRLPPPPDGAVPVAATVAGVELLFTSRSCAEWLSIDVEEPSSTGNTRSSQ